jgi:hypothetical protein
MEIPHLVREHLGGEAIESTVNLGDEDVVCVTPTRALVYRGEGLLSDESVQTYSLDVEQLDISQGRRKTKFIFEYVDGTDTFTVPASRSETLLTLLLQGAFRVAGVIDEEESVAGVFEFSELTLVVTDSRLVKHVGATLWDEDFESFHYDDVSGLAFEEGSVATQIVITVDGRPQRIKAPSEEAPQVKQTLVQTMCAYYDVGSLEALQETLSAAEDVDGGSADASAASNDIGLDEGISPLVGGDADADSEAPDQPAETDARAGEEQRQQRTTETRSENTGQSAAGAAGESRSGGGDGSGTRQTAREIAASGTAADGVDAEDVEAIKEQLSTLTAAVKRQNELLERHEQRLGTHDERIEQLIDELRRGR